MLQRKNLAEGALRWFRSMHDLDDMDVKDRAVFDAKVQEAYQALKSAEKMYVKQKL